MKRGGGASPEKDVENLLKTGNLGRIAEAEFKQGEKTPVYFSVDRQTNEPVACRADRVKIPEQIKDMELNHRQKQDLAEEKAVWMEGMTSKKGKPFDVFVQFNTDRRGFEFRFDNNQSQGKSNTQEYRQRNGQGDVPETFRKKELSEDQRNSLREGKTVHVDGLVDKKGKASLNCLMMIFGVRSDKVRRSNLLFRYTRHVFKCVPA